MFEVLITGGGLVYIVGARVSGKSVGELGGGMTPGGGKEGVYSLVIMVCVPRYFL